MARAIEQIERDIAALQEAIRAIAAELHNAYASYLNSLGQALQKQLILAIYHLCTQGYPENFLKLSLHQRQQLQQAMRKLGQQSARQLLTYLNSEGDEGDEGDEEDEGDEGDEEDEGDEGDVETENIIASPFELASDAANVPNIALTDLPETAANLLGNSADLEAVASQTPTSSPHPPIPMSLSSSPVSLSATQEFLTPDLSNPVELVKWQQSLEYLTQQTLKKASHEANVLLQKVGILPKKLPEPILEAAAAVSEASAEVMPGPPNLLNLVIEIENEQDAENSGLTQIMTINLRLGEIEFADAMVSSGRKQIRNILVQLNKVGREYQKKQRERSVAEAEAAWRASWFE
ncbi:hypothetical protein I8752_04770 [Nostocaceae cyanobacterium CENA369]|uniref:Uncharacterized protein n=1 Tax=Dendronalium phyllosphericum CENA369 TaxID=1725256 RepID=A0A8J7I6B9_9NOST|nr:hypothetical protein [Dendronalium phyllosphericum]MBH8572357.1 hypothetical protein [Dendronalium phyllosphericum CENA369]